MFGVNLPRQRAGRPIARSSGVIDFTVRPAALFPLPPTAACAPNAPNSTLVRERFMALHMIWLKMMPELPTSAPEMISTWLSITKPVMPAAMPEYELRSEITTGISAPPIGMTRSTPRIREPTSTP